MLYDNADDAMNAAKAVHKRFCKFCIAWSGTCNNPMPCKYHGVCSICKIKPATYGCCHTSQFVCGAELCNSEGCRNIHNQSHRSY